jgi:integrase/recombinase XerD
LRFQYQIHLKEAEGLSEKTIDAVVAAIAEFEEHLGYRPFTKLHRRHSESFKRHLMSRDSKADGKPLAKSTIVHTLQHVRGFLAWLRTRKGYKHLDPDIPAFMSPPRRDEMALRTPPPKTGFSMPDLIKVIAGMPCETLVERRDRAAIALIALTGARDGALITLQRKHIDIVQSRLNQDASEVDTKFGKNLWTYFFPVPEPVGQIVEDWVAELDLLNWPDDAPLLPRDVSQKGLAQPQHWKTAAPVISILRNACAAAGVKYTPPHSIRHTLAVSGDEVCRTLMDKKAWSQNLGHQSLITTEQSYGTLEHEVVGSALTGMVKRQPHDDIVRFLETAGEKQIALFRAVMSLEQ